MLERLQKTFESKELTSAEKLQDRSPNLYMQLGHYFQTQTSQSKLNLYSLIGRNQIH